MDSPEDIALADRMNAGRKKIDAEMGKLIVGQEEVVNQVMLTLFVGGNSLIVGVPGLAKTLLVRTLAQVLDLKFNRIQFTPDLMPSDITGTDIIQEDAATGRRQMVFAPGPIFANIVLADEINRTPPKTQSALLEAMQEHRVTIQGRPNARGPFYVFATQNPIESRARIRCRKRSSIASCSTSSSTTTPRCRAGNRTSRRSRGWSRPAPA